jgi:putative transposase
LDNSIDQFPRLIKIWADSGYQGEYTKAYCNDFEVDLEIVKRSDREPGFKVVARRWVVERTFAWLSRQRRLSKDYEYTPNTSETMIYMSMTRTMLRRAAHAIGTL